SRVEAARERQLTRAGRSNAALGSREIEQTCVLDSEGRDLIQRAIERLGLSARAYHRILKVARTIADLDDEYAIQPAHLSEAIGYRRLDRNL
ncbi:ATP-dependent protease, partial [Pseudomonadota bacterium]